MFTYIFSNLILCEHDSLKLIYFDFLKDNKNYGYIQITGFLGILLRKLLHGTLTIANLIIFVELSVVTVFFILENHVLIGFNKLIMSLIV